MSGRLARACALLAILRSRPFLTFAIVAAGLDRRRLRSCAASAPIGHLRYLVELAAVIGLVAHRPDLRRDRRRHRPVGRPRSSPSAPSSCRSLDLGRRSDRRSARSPPSLVVADGDRRSSTALGIALLRVHPMIMTLAMATFLQGLLIIIAGGSAISAQNPLVAWLGNARPGWHSRRHPALAGGRRRHRALRACTRTPLGARIFAHRRQSAGERGSPASRSPRRP